MKRKYVKPAYLAEEFGFAQTIAQVCTGDRNDSYPTHASKDSCAWAIDGDIFVFITSVAACTHPIASDGDYSDICYNTPTNGTAVFASY